MSDDNKKPINPNTDDDLNLDFDIILDQNEELNKSKEESKLNSEQNQQKDLDLDFDINPSSQENTQQSTEKEVITPEIKTEELISTVNQTDNNSIEQIQDNEKTKQLDNTEYNPSLKASNETIQQLQEAKEQWKQIISSNNLDEFPTIQTIDAKIIKQETKPTNEITSWTINLDEILTTSQPKKETPIKDIPQIQFPQSIQQSPKPYDIAPQQTIKINNDEHKKHLIMIIWVVGVCLIAWFFILKTMYPIQFGSNNWWSWTNTENIDTTPQDPNPFQDTTPTTTTEDVIFTWENIEITWTNENSDQISWNIQEHNITGGIDPFQDLDNLQTQDEIKKQATIDSLKDFANKWQYYLDMWKEKWIKDMIKYWVYLTGKGTSFINQIENWEILDISSLDSYLAQFSISLQKLQDLENAPDTTSQEPSNTPEESSWFNQTWGQETAPEWSTWENTQL